MTRSIRTPIVVALAATALALSASAAGAQQPAPAADSGTATTHEYIPFVTDFGIEPRPAGEPVVINPQPAGEAASRNWGDIAVGSALGFALAALLAGAALGVRRMRGHAVHAGAEAR